MHLQNELNAESAKEVERLKAESGGLKRQIRGILEVLDDPARKKQLPDGGKEVSLWLLELNNVQCTFDRQEISLPRNSSLCNPNPAYQSLICSKTPVS